MYLNVQVTEVSDSERTSESAAPGPSGRGNSSRQPRLRENIAWEKRGLRDGISPELGIQVRWTHEV